MTKREIANLCCRVLAVYALLQALQQLPELTSLFAPFAERGNDWLSATYYVLRAAVPLLLGFAAWFFWRWSWLIAASMVGYDIQDAPDEPESIRERATAAQLHAVAFSVLGLWILIETVPMAVSELTNSVYIRMLGSEISKQATAREAATLIKVLFRVIIGLYLLFGASGLIELLRRLKNVGLERKDGSKDGGEAS